MKKILIVITALVVIAAVGWLVLSKKFTPQPVVNNSQTNLEGELMTTEDDAEAVDFRELDKSAEGL